MFALRCGSVAGRGWWVLPVVVWVLTCAGCNDAAPKPAEQPNKAVTAPVDNPAEKQPEVQEPVRVDPVQVAVDQLPQVQSHLDKNELDQAEKLLGEIRPLREKFATEPASQFDKLDEALEDKRRAEMADRRAKNLAAGEDFLTQGKLEEATAALDKVLTEFPTEEQKEKVASLTASIEERRKLRRDLTVAMRMLASTKSTDLRDARRRLVEAGDAAFGIVVEAVHSDNPTLSANALEALKAFNEPQRTLPVLLGVLGKPERKALWPLTVRELQKLGIPGTGAPLLELALRAQDADQRLAALTALSGSQDPPVDTFAKLLPLLFQDGPELAIALHVAQHVVITHRQFDLFSRRGLDVELSGEEEVLLNNLPARLEKLSQLPKGTDSVPEVVQAAMSLAMLTKLVAPQPLTGVKIVRASAELPESPKEAVLDGVWDSVEPKSMWRHPVDKPVSILLDLGTERTVAGLRFWNENEVNLRHRGWKEVEIFVSNSTSSINSSGKGLLPQAPGVAGAPDYATTVPISCVRGRYIRLEVRSYWQPDGVAGLTELQVLGF